MCARVCSFVSVSCVRMPMRHVGAACGACAWKVSPSRRARRGAREGRSSQLGPPRVSPGVRDASRGVRTCWGRHDNFVLKDTAYFVLKDTALTQGHSFAQTSNNRTGVLVVYAANLFSVQFSSERVSRLRLVVA